MHAHLSGSFGKNLVFTISEGSPVEDIQQMSKRLADAVTRFGKVRLLIEIIGFRHMDPEALLDRVGFIRDHFQDIERLAVLSNRVWIKSWLKNGGLLTHTEMDHFDRSETESALEWLNS